VTRPMNPYFLYRAAFNERIQELRIKWHDIVSMVAAESWPLETPQIREFYSKLAKIESMNHKLAFPGYKYRGNKA
ncbi:hypothetical protein BDV96DRAFT_465970, partial [Lophiotrema nucula]